MNGAALLADHIEARTDAIVAAWRDAVEQAGDVPDSEGLTYPEFADHIPALLDRLAERLRGRSTGSVEPGKKHGRMLFRQGYDITEIISELGHLRRALNVATLECAERHDFDLGTIGAAHAVIDEVLNEATAGAVGDFHEASRAEKRAALERAEAERQLILDSVREFAIFSLDASGRVATWNRGAERVFGYSEDEIVGQGAAILFTPEDRRDRVPEEELETAAATGHAGDDRWHLRKDGRRIFVSGVVTPIRDESGAPRGFTKVARDITERTRAEEALKEADRRKDEFLAILSHELRNPIGAIRTAVQVARSPGAEEHLSWCHEVIGRQVGHLARLTDDLLDISRIAQGKIELRRQSVELPHLIARAAEAVRPLVERKGHRLTVEVAPDVPRIDADPTRIEQVLINLLTNAAKYTEDGGRITVAAGRRGDRAVIRVSDTGIGIPPEKLPRIFETFIQIDDSRSRSEGGLGIGLSLVRRLVELHGGTVLATSEPGQGSEFTVELPAGADALPSVVPEIPPPSAE
jgi:PAS domain S-box-containing protein